MYGGYFSFSMFTTLILVSFNTMEKKVHNTEKIVRSSEIVLLQADNYQY